MSASASASDPDPDRASRGRDRSPVPDGCNAGIALRVALGVNAALAAVAAAAAATLRSPGEFSVLFFQIAAVAEPATFLSLLVWCAMRRRARPRSDRAQRLVAWAVPGVAAAVVQALLRTGMSAASAGSASAVASAAASAAEPVIVAAAFGGLGGIAVQHYLELRARAYSPAIDEAKFQALQSRIRPHFFFNSLNAVLAVLREDPPRAERMLESVAELFRAVMGDVRRMVPFAEEMELCRRYVEIEQTRFGNRLVVRWDVGAVHPDARVPQLLLQPIIENAVRYGAERSAAGDGGPCEIDVRVRQVGFQLKVFVSNPIAAEPVQREGNQIGLRNIRGRLALIYDLEAQLDARVRGRRFELTLSLPVSRLDPRAGAEDGAGSGAGAGAERDA